MHWEVRHTTTQRDRPHAALPCWSPAYSCRCTIHYQTWSSPNTRSNARALLTVGTNRKDPSSHLAQLYQQWNHNCYRMHACRTAPLKPPSPLAHSWLELNTAHQCCCCRPRRAPWCQQPWPPKSHRRNRTDNSSNHHQDSDSSHWRVPVPTAPQRPTNALTNE